ncbi:hypothetical protein MASR2M78_13390 [Treponema sp.]
MIYPIEPHAAHGGNLLSLSKRSGLNPRDILDFSVNVNPFGPPEWLAEEIQTALDEIRNYPDPQASRLRKAAASRWDVEEERIVCSNGSDELFHAVVHALGVSRMVVPVPSYASYRVRGVQTKKLVLVPEEGFILNFKSIEGAMDEAGPGCLLILGFPNNPTGILPSAAELEALARSRTQDWFIVDEAFMDFVDGKSSLAQKNLPNLIVIRSLTKFWSVPGIRLGLAICPSGLASVIRRELSEWPVNVFAERVGARALADRAFDMTASKIVLLREKLCADLKKLPNILVQEGAAANFLLLRVSGISAGTLEEAVLRRGVAIRDCSNFPSLEGPQNGWVRVAVKKETDNAGLVLTLQDAMIEAASPCS